MSDRSMCEVSRKLLEMKSHLFRAFVFIVLFAPLPATAAGMAKLAPHRAVYDMTLARATSVSGVSELTGRMVYEITGDACRGYVQNMRFVTRSVDQSGNASVMDLRSKFIEDGHAQTFKFETNSYQDKRLREEAVGTAKRDRSQKSVDVRMSRPKPQRFNLSPKVLFPIEHTLRLLEAAQRGDIVFTADLYDGSDEGAKAYTTTAVMGAKKSGAFNANMKRIKNAEALDGLAAWPVSLAYFEQHEKRAEGLPSYELGFLIYENGVSRTLLLDYGSFAIRGQLSALEMLGTPACDQ